jgi:hypothetical protein
MKYDSRPDTYAHIQTVQKFLHRVATMFLQRAEDHDASKLEDPELSVFNEYTPKLADTEYGSDQYKIYLKEMQDTGLAHHYAHNAHHPEYYEDGIRGMSLVDLVEMLVDWKAATMRHNRHTGDILRSIEINQERFGYSDEVKQILVNTAHDLSLTNEPDQDQQQKSRRSKVWKS